MSTQRARADFEQARHLLQQDIQAGVLQPNEKLKIKALIARYGIGSSPMREALSQLSATGMVRQEAQRGFRVAPISHAELLDITASRQIIETEALTLAMKHGDRAWEDEIVASYHVFEREVVRFYTGEERDLDSYEAQHHRFHRALIAACPIQTLKTFCDDLYGRATRYRRLTRSYGFDLEPVLAEHRLLMEAVLARKPRAAVAACRHHIGLTADIMFKVLESRGPAAMSGVTVLSVARRSS